MTRQVLYDAVAVFLAVLLDGMADVAHEPVGLGGLHADLQTLLRHPHQLKVTTAAGYEAKLANGKSIFDGYGSDPEAAPTAAQTAAEVAAWCAKSGTVAFTVSKEGYAKQTSVDFGGNFGEKADNGLANSVCRWFYIKLGYNPDDC